MIRVITAQEAFDNGISSQSLERVADWNTKMAEKAKFAKERERLIYQAGKLREVCQALSANNLD